MKSDLSRSRQKMPTAAKAVSAVGLAVVAVGVSNILVYRFPGLTETGVNPIFFATVGFCLGWTKIGPAAYFGYRAVWRAGIGAAIATAVVIALVAAMHHIYKGMVFHQYKNVDDMLTNLMKKTLENVLYLADPYLLAAIVFGGLLVGIFSGFSARLWR